MGIVSVGAMLCEGRQSRKSTPSATNSVINSSVFDHRESATHDYDRTFPLAQLTGGPGFCEVPVFDQSVAELKFV
jgi:hypothetical protein